MTYGNILFSVALLLLIITFVYNALNFASSTQNADWVAHTYNVKQQIERLYSDLKDAERGERGFLLTMDPTYLNLYQAALQDESATLKTLHYLIRDNPNQEKNLAATTNLIQQRQALLQKILNLQQKGNPIAARALIRQGKGLHLMLAIQHKVHVMLVEEEHLLATRLQALQRHRDRVWFLSYLFFGLAVLSLIGGYILLRKSNARIKHLYEEKERYAEQLEQSNQDFALVALIASHDLKPPLRKINFFIEQIQKDPETIFSSESQNFFDRMQKSLQKMQQLIEFVLAIAQHKQSELPVELINFDILARDVLEALAPQIREKNALIEVNGKCAFDGDKYEIAQLLKDLLESSLQAYQPDESPRIKISAEKAEDGGCEIQLKDNHVGLTHQQQPHIFQVFHRTKKNEASTQREAGLSTVRKIADGHHGSVKVKHKAGEGSEFIVKLPPLTGPSYMATASL